MSPTSERFSEDLSFTVISFDYKVIITYIYESVLLSKRNVSKRAYPLVFIFITTTATYFHLGSAKVYRMN